MNLTKTKCTLKEALNFNGDVIIWKFMENYDVSFDEGHELFEETKKWLWFSVQNRGAFIDKSMMMIDNMWHTFILFTKEYAEYCHSKYGRFLHHRPSTKEEKDNHKKNLLLNKEKTKKEAYLRSKKQYEAIYDQLGKETLIKWYKVFPEKYSVNRIHELTIKV